MDVWNASVVEKVRVGDCGYEDGGEVGYLVFVSREEVEVVRAARSYNFSESCNGWEQGWRCLALAVDAVEDEYELLFSLQQVLELYDEGADALRSSVEDTGFFELSMCGQCLFYDRDCPFE